MNNELLLLIKKHTDTLIQQRKTRPQEVLEFKMNKGMETFSPSPPTNSIEEGKWLLAVTFFETTNSVFIITDENNSFLITTPSHWNFEYTDKTIDQLNKLIVLRSENGIELLVEQVKKKRIFLTKDYSLSSRGTFKNEILEEIKNSKNNVFEDMVYRFQLTYDEMMVTLDLKYIPTTTIR